MTLMRIAKYSFAGSLTLALAACGGGGGGGGSSTSTAPAAASLSMSIGVQGLDLSWTPVSGVTSYRLYQDATGSSGFTRVGGDIAAASGSYRLPVSSHLLDWPNARFRIDACNGDSCTASQPISVVSGMLASITYVKASNTQDGSRFGGSAALSGDGRTLVVGSPQVKDEAEGLYVGDRSVAGSGADNHGAVYVYQMGSNGLWSQVLYLKAPHIRDADGNPEGGFGARFGTGVAVNSDGSVIAVGAAGEGSGAVGVNGDQTDSTLIDSGAVYVYSRDTGGNWSEPTYLKSSNSRDNQLFGAAISLNKDGNRLVVGAPGEDSPAKGVNGNGALTGSTDSGAAYLFEKSGGAWAQKAYLKASNSRANARFGDSVALAGDGQTVAVGSPGEKSSARGINGNQNAAGLDDSGAVYVFAYDNGAALWTQQSYIKASNTPLAIDVIDGPEFGTSVSLSDNGALLAVGAPYVDSDNATLSSNDNTRNLGAVYLFKRAAAWVQTAMLKTVNTGMFADVGSSVALSGDGTLLAIGAPGDATLSRGINGSTASAGGINENGGVFMFAIDGNGAGTQRSYVKASNTMTSSAGLWLDIRSRFGDVVALSTDGKRLAVGAPGEYGMAKGVHNGADVAGSDVSRPEAGAVYLY